MQRFQHHAVAAYGDKYFRVLDRHISITVLEALADILRVWPFAGDEAQ
nr:hypothetical protein [Hyphobacterium sp. CCMP332]